MCVNQYQFTNLDVYLGSVVTVSLLKTQVAAIFRSAVLVQAMLIFLLNLKLSKTCSDIVSRPDQARAVLLYFKGGSEVCIGRSDLTMFKI